MTITRYDTSDELDMDENFISYLSEDPRGEYVKALDIDRIITFVLSQDDANIRNLLVSLQSELR